MNDNIVSDDVDEIHVQLNSIMLKINTAKHSQKTHTNTDRCRYTQYKPHVWSWMTEKNDT